ncbi:hypothetical protein UVI_02035660 [Ustilaginoidea virens]|nr:hypothetical protein UVI_02035660 [Ustilaginoidea virens]
MRELASVIPVGHYHFLNVQRLLHSCYWYKAEAKFLEAWHVLSAAILEARELGYHKEPAPGSVTDFDLEMRRRLWCILDTWDWQISSGLSRPKIIDRAGCNAKLPELTLEGHVVSPLLHMKMQSRLTRQLATRFSAPKNIIAPSEVHEYKEIIEKWVEQFPPEYSFENPDTTKDQKCPWLFAHRFYVYTMACLLILNPIRHYMVKQYTWESPGEETEIRGVGIWYSLKLMKTLRLWVDKVHNRDGRLHFIIFSIFDTAAILCTAILKDAENTIGNRQDILAAVGDAVDMLQKLNQISKTSKTSHDILERLVRRLPDFVPRKEMERQMKRPKFTARSPPLAPAPEESRSTSSSPHSSATPRGLGSLPTTAVTTTHEQAPVVTAPIPASGSISAAPLPVPLSATATPTATPTVDLTPHQSDYDNSGFAPPPLSQTGGFVAANSQVISGSLSGSDLADEYHGWTSASESAPLNMDGHGGMMSSFAAMPKPLSMDEAAAAYQQQIAEPVPEFNIENLSEAQLGELAPLWNWHSENLDFANMPPASLEPGTTNDYSQSMQNHGPLS